MTEIPYDIFDVIANNKGDCIFNIRKYMEAEVFPGKSTKDFLCFLSDEPFAELEERVYLESDLYNRDPYTYFTHSTGLPAWWVRNITESKIASDKSNHQKMLDWALAIVDHEHHALVKSSAYHLVGAYIGHLNLTEQDYEKRVDLFLDTLTKGLERENHPRTRDVTLRAVGGVMGIIYHDYHKGERWAREVAKKCSMVKTIADDETESKKLRKSCKDIIWVADVFGKQ